MYAVSRLSDLTDWCVLYSAVQARAFSELVIPMPERLMRDEMGQYEGGAFHRLAPGMAT
jgi:hypothetical protein